KVTQLWADGNGKNARVVIDLKCPRHAVVGRDDDRACALRCGEIVIDRCHLFRHVVPSHAVSKHLVLGIESGSMESTWWSDRDDELKERDEFEHACNDDGDLKAGTKPWTLDLRDRHEPLSLGDRNRSGRVVGLADEEE